jgi:signal transduction histidine kinase
MPQVRKALQTAHPELSNAIQGAIQNVCARHVEEVRREFPVATRYDADTATDDLPNVLKGLAETFSREDALQSLAVLGPAHASARDGQGFTLLEVFGEYVLLRRSLRDEVVSHLGRPLSATEAEAFQSGMDALLAATLASFTAQREARLRLETTALGHFLASLSHDLRNEINGVVTTMQALEETGQDVLDAIRRAGTQIETTATNQIANLLREASACRSTMESTIAAMTRLLEAERLRNQVALQMREVAMANLMQSVVRSAARIDRGTNPQISRAAERIKVNCPEDLRFKTDPDVLGSVLVNLIGNAVKHAPEGDILFNATITPEGHCRIEVRDHGPGIPKEKIQDLFEKFERAAPHQTTGLGLGLFIARRAAHLLGGKISVQSEVGHGSRFVIELPAPKDSAA